MTTTRFRSGARRTRRTALTPVVCASLFLTIAFFASPAARTQQTAVTNAKDAAPDPKAFVGTWKASYHGDVFAILVLRQDRGSLAGTLNNFDLSFDKEGNLTDGTHKDSGDAPLLNVHFKSGALQFVVMQKDQYAPSTEWKFVLKSTGEAELIPSLDHQLNTPQDATIKPIPMFRDHPSK
jgi:hypothetical protein